MTDEKDKDESPAKKDADAKDASDSPAETKAEAKDDAPKASEPDEGDADEKSKSEKSKSDPPAKSEVAEAKASADDDSADEEEGEEEEPPPKSMTKPTGKPAAKPDAAKDDASSKGASWAAPLVKFDTWWTKWEARMVVAVLGAEILALSIWVLLKGLSAEWHPGASDTTGVVWRGALGAVVLGLIANRVLKPKDAKDEKAVKTHQLGVTGAVIVGAVAARFWGSAGSEYFSNLLNWLQSASSLTLIGGLRGVATRLTLWVALLGGSLATSQGKHINVDVVMRFVPVKARVPIAVIGWMTAAIVCLSGAYGFVDHLAIAEFKIMQDGPCEGNPTETCHFTFGDRMGKVRHEARRDLFLLGRQASLDLKTFPKVLGGTKYKDYLHPQEWNEWLNGNEGWTEYFPKEDVDGQKLDESDATVTRLPIINVPGGNEDTNGLLRRDADFIFPFGLLMIALRFILRSILAIAGWVKVDPAAAHGDPDIQDAHKSMPSEAKS